MELADGGLAAAIQVAPRVVGEQIAQVFHAEPGKGLHPARARAPQALQTDPGQIPPGQHRGLVNHCHRATPEVGAYSTPT